MLVHGLGKVRNVEIGVTVICDRLKLGVEGLLDDCQCDACLIDVMPTHPSKADLVAEMVEATDAVLGVLVVVVADKSKAYLS